MKTLTVRLPEQLVAEINAESRERKMSKSDVIRERLQARSKSGKHLSTPVELIGDLIGSVDGLPRDLSARKKHYLKAAAMAAKVLVDAGFVVALLSRRDSHHSS